MRVKYARKLSISTTGGRTDTGLCEPLWSIRLKCELGLTTKLEMMLLVQAQVCGGISAHLGLPHQKRNKKLVMHACIKKVS